MSGQRVKPGSGSLEYSYATTQPPVDMTNEGSGKGASTEYTAETDKSMMDRLKEALKPGDLRRQEQEGRRQEGVLLQSSGPAQGNQGRGYAEMNRGRVAVENPADPGSRGVLSAVGGARPSEGGGGGGVVGKIKEMFQGSSASPAASEPGAAAGSYSRESPPGAAEAASSARAPGGAGTDTRGYARAPPLDPQGLVGHEFSVSTLDSLS